jgi:hypothetical protein
MLRCIAFLLAVTLFFIVFIPASLAIDNLTITPVKAYTINDLSCNFVITGSSATYGANVSWYFTTNGSWSFSNQDNLSCSNNTLCSSVLPYSVTAKGQTWNCSIIAYNSTEEYNSTTRAISNSPPDFDPTPTYFDVNESQFFSKLFSATDYDDSDELNYFINSGDINKTSSFSCFGGSAGSGTATFNINSVGNLTINASRDEVGNYSVGISVQDNDTSPITTTLFVNFSINCLYIQPTLGDISNQTVEFNQSFFLQVDYELNDADNLTFQDNASFFNISSSGQISFTTGSISDIGEHIVNISMNDGEDEYDPGNYSYSRIVTFTISKPPVINWTNVTVIDKATGNETSINNTDINLAESTMSVLFNASAYDDPDNANLTGYGSLSYAWKLNGTIMSNNQSWLFEPSYGIQGSYIVLLEVNSSYNISASASWNMTVNKTYRYPLFKPYLRPKLNISYDNQTTTLEASKDAYIYDETNYGGNGLLVVDTNKNSLLYFNISSLPDSINITEAVLFLYLVSGENTTANITLYRLTSDWEENETTWANRSQNSTWNTSGGDYDNSTVYNCTVNAVYSWYNWTVTELVRGLYNETYNNSGLIVTGSVQKEFASSDYKEPIPDITLPENVDNQTDIYLDHYFLDIDGEGLTYNYSTDPTYLTISITNTSRVIYKPLHVGTTTVVFSAINPGNKTADSNTVTVVIEPLEGQDTPVITVPSYQTTTIEHLKKASLDIVISPIISADPSDEIAVPFNLENSGEVVLRDIELSLISSIQNASISLSETNIDQMLVEEVVDVNLTILTRDIEPGRYNITIIANATDPGIKQSTMVYIDILEVGKEIQKEVMFAKDLFEENPECYELMDTLDRVQNYIDDKDYVKAQSLVTSSIENCKALIKYKEAETPFALTPDLIRNIVLIVLSAGVLFYIVLRVGHFKLHGKS